MKGWYGQSHRHYLAAKGIKTKKYMAPVIKGRALRDQLHTGSDKVDKFKVEENKEDTFPQNYLNKPNSAFWTSTQLPPDEKGSNSSWEQFINENNVSWYDDKKGKRVVIIPDPDAKIFLIDSREDLLELFDKYPLESSIEHVGSSEKKLVIDWDAFKKDYDAVTLSSFGRASNMSSAERLHLRDWDVESTAWLRPKFTEKPFEPKGIEKPKKKLKNKEIARLKHIRRSWDFDNKMADSQLTKDAEESIRRHHSERSTK